MYNADLQGTLKSSDLDDDGSEVMGHPDERVPIDRVIGGQ